MITTKLSLKSGGAAVALTLVLSRQSAWAQGQLTVSGTVKDAKTGEDLSGALVHAVELSGVGTAANTYGFYTLTLPAGPYTVEATFVGYKLLFRLGMVLGVVLGLSGVGFGLNAVPLAPATPWLGWLRST